MKTDFNPNIRISPSFGRIKPLNDEVREHIAKTFTEADMLYLDDCMYVQEDNPASITLLKRNKKYLKAVIHNPLTDRNITVKQRKRLSNFEFLSKMCEKADNIWFLKRWR